MGLLGVKYLPIILAYVGWSIPGTTVILKNFFDTIPKELLEAARIDGSGEIRNLFKIVLPLMKGALATCIVMNFTFVWGEHRHTDDDRRSAADRRSYELQRRVRNQLAALMCSYLYDYHSAVCCIFIPAEILCFLPYRRKCKRLKP